jgi:3-deoxy-D-manno-octulosonate 8-phosphate phosphatase KdsC-like HAD superfamily phosphatase
METTTKEQEIEKVIIETCIRIGRRGEGSIIVLGEAKYNPMVEQKIIPFNIIENPKTFESLCLMDGAIIVKLNGTLEAYGCKLKNGLDILKNFGTRHSAGMYASQTKGTTVFVVSEEDRKLRVFKEGKIIMEIDCLAKGIEKQSTEITKILESVGIGTMSVLGAGLLAPVFGIVLVSGVTVFVAATGVSYFIKKAIQFGWLKK